MKKVTIFLIKETQEEAIVLKKMLESHVYSVIGIATSYQEALVMFVKLPVDIFITDMMINGNPDGIAFVENILLSKKNICPFIYLTGFENREFYQRAKLTKPYAILHKPFNEIAIRYSLEKIVEKLETASLELEVIAYNQALSMHQASLLIKKKNALYRVPIEDIIYIEVDNRYCNIVTNKEKFLVLISLGKVKEFLNDNMFLQIHRKYVVNSNAIEQIIPKDNLIILKGNHTVTLGVKYKNILKEFIILK